MREADKELRKLTKQYQLIQRKANTARTKADEVSMKREIKDRELKEKITLQEDMQRKVEDKKKEINAKIHERKLLNGDLVT